MWCIPWAILVVAFVVVVFLGRRMQPYSKALGTNFIDSKPRFRRHDLEQVRSVLEHHAALLAKHRKAAAIDLWFAPAFTVLMAAWACGVAWGKVAMWLPLGCAIVAGIGDQVENFIIRRILASPHRPVPKAEVTPLAVATTVKFIGYLLAFVVPVILLASPR